MKISDITGIACDGCKHYPVCKFSEEFISAQQAVDEAAIHFTTEQDGKTAYASRPISCIDYILPIKLQCKYMEKIPTNNIRSYEAACAAEGICQ